MSSKTFIPIVLIVLLWEGCGTGTDVPNCPYVYQQQQLKNVSSTPTPLGKSRTNAQDGYAPNFEWRRSDGTLDSLSAHQGTVILLNFWATWCGPCVSEMPAIQSVADEMKDSVLVIGIDEDHVCDPFPTVNNFIQGKGIRYQIVVDSNYELYYRYFPNVRENPSLYAIPQSFFIDRNGSIRYAEAGVGDKAAFETFIRNSSK